MNKNLDITVKKTKSDYFKLLIGECVMHTGVVENVYDKLLSMKLTREESRTLLKKAADVYMAKVSESIELRCDKHDEAIANIKKKKTGQKKTPPKTSGWI